jgi:catechol 2,3-dioxygenase-like lactoylglutathione lyase family enzyme
MYSHMMVGSNDIARSKQFYDATFQAFGGNAGILDDKGRLMYIHNDGMFIVTPPIDGKPATHGNGCTIGFTMEPAQADAWYKAGAENGGTAIEDAPGMRDVGAMKLYLAYLRDPDGNKLCAFHRMA